MDVESRLTAMEARLRAAEDQLEILHLLNSYGPLADSGESRSAAALWTEDGVYDAGGFARFEGRDAITGIIDDEGHRALIDTGSAHVTATPRIVLHGDTAEAVAYSFVLLRSEGAWDVWRASANHWRLERTNDGWRIVERFNRVLDGSDASHDVLRRATH
jgi:hypothetical protein